MNEGRKMGRKERHTLRTEGRKEGRQVGKEGKKEGRTTRLERRTEGKKERKLVRGKLPHSLSSIISDIHRSPLTSPFASDITFCL